MTIYQPDPDRFASAISRTVSYRHKRGVLLGTGADRLDLLHRLSTNALIDLKPGHERSTVLTTEKGRIIDLVRVVVVENEILMVLASEEGERVRLWLDKYTIMDDFECRDVSDLWRIVGVYGEGARAQLAIAFSCDPPDAGSHVDVDMADGTGRLLRDSRLNGATGFLLLVPSAAEANVMQTLADAGVQEIDDACYQTLRVVAGVPESGTELNDLYNPLEAGISQYISWTKGCYIGQEVIARLDTYDKVQRHLVGLRFVSSPDISADDRLTLLSLDGDQQIGQATTLARRPHEEAPVGLAYVRTEYAVPGLEVRAGGSLATITNLPIES